MSRRDVLAALQEHAESERLCTRVAQVCRAAASAKQADWLSGRTVSSDSVPLAPLSPEEAETAYGNVLSILDRGAQTPLEWCVLGAATAVYVMRKTDARAPNSVDPTDALRPDDADWNSETNALLDDVAWLAAHTGCDAWSFLSLAGEAETRSLWSLVNQRRDAWQVPAQLALAVGIMEAGSPEALSLKASWLEQSGHPTLLSLLETSSTSPWLDGQLRHVPSRGMLFIQAITGYLFIKAVARILARYLFWRRQRCRLRISPRGLELVGHTSLLGRPFREQRRLIPLSEITELTRQTRFSGLGVYLGLGCLLLGTFFGTGLVVDALRAPGSSPSLLGLGLALLLLGLVADFIASHWGRVIEGKGELRVRRRKGRRLTLGGLEPSAVNELIERLSRLGAFAGASFTSNRSSAAPRAPGG